MTRMAKLLEPGGVLVVVGLARGPSPAGLLLTVPAVAGRRRLTRRLTGPGGSIRCRG